MDLSSAAQADALVLQVCELQARHEEEIAELERLHRLEIEALKARYEGVDREQSIGKSHSSSAATFSDEHLDEKQNFISFIKGVAKGKESPEYKRLYKILLKCFSDADNNFDGRVGFQEFNMLLESAALLPRRWGFAPSTAELYATEWDRLKQRMTIFASLNPKTAAKIDLHSKDEEFKYITFDQWLKYAVEHINEKALLLKDVDPTSQMVKSRKSFGEFVINSCRSRSSQEYKELYSFLLKCFTDADTDMDGLIDADSFSNLIDRAASAPRLFGFAPEKDQIYKSDEDAERERLKLFHSLDKENTGFIDFDTWLQYMLKHVCEKASLLGETGRQVPVVLATGPQSSGPQGCPFGF